jgi:putative oxidoreductase
MRSLFRLVFSSPRGAGSILFVRLAVGLIFFTQGILKYVDPKMGVERFTRIGFAHPYFAAHSVGTFEIVCGLLVLIGLLTGTLRPGINVIFTSGYSVMHP